MSPATSILSEGMDKLFHRSHPQTNNEAFKGSKDSVLIKYDI